MKTSIWVIFLLMIIPIFSWGLAQYQYDKDDPMNRFNRAVATSKPNPPSQKGGQKQSVPELVKRHMALARIFNALYLQQQLSNDRIGPYDLIAGLWNLKNKTVVEKLVSLKVDGLSDSLTQLETAIKTVPDDLTVIADVQTINAKLSSVKEITDENRASLLKASDQKYLPICITDQHLLNNFNFQDDRAAKALGQFDTLKNTPPDQFSEHNARNFGEALFQIRFAFEHLPDFLQKVGSESGKSLSILVDGLSVAEVVKQKKADLDELSQQFTGIVSRLNDVDSLKSGFDTVKTKQDLNELQNVLEELHQNHSYKSITSAFISSQDFAKVTQDLQDKWLMQVFNNGRYLNALRKNVSSVNTFSNKFTEIEKHQNELWELNHFNGINSASQVLGDIEKLRQYSDKPHPLPSIDCNQFDESGAPLASSDITSLSAAVDEFLKAVPAIQKTLSNYPDLTTIVSDLDEHESKIKVLRKPEQFESWLNSTAPEELKTILDKSEKLFKSLKQSDEFMKAVKLLIDNKVKILNTQKWIATIKIGASSCDTLFSFTPDPLAKLNGLPRSIKNLKTGSLISKLQPLLTTISKVSAGLKKLNFASTTTEVTLKPPSVPSKEVTPKPTVPSKPKRSTDEDSGIVKNPENLLEFAFAAKSIQQMELINQYDKDISTIIGANGPVSKAISKVSDPEKKQKLSNIWKDFNVFEAKLKAIQANNKLAIAKLSEQKLEKNLQEVAYVYSNLTTLKPSERAELRKYRESLILLDPRHDDVEKAMERLEGPLATDWAMAHASFKKMPDALVELQKDFAKFFGGTGEDESGAENVLGVSIGGGFFLIFIIVLIVGCACYCHHYYDPALKKKLPKEAMYTPTDEAVEKAYTYMQFQDSRLPLNKRDKTTGNTPIFDAIVARDWDKVKELIGKGAILDATNNGNKNRTALFELVLMKEVHVGRLFLKADADREVHDYVGEDCDTWGDENGFRGLFDKDYHRHRTEPHERYLPEVARPWNILVFDAKCFPRKLRKRLPLRIRKFITWGYKPEMDLDEFTTIIVPPKYIHGEKALILKDNNIMPWKFYGCKAVLQKVSWFHWFLAKDDISEQTKIQEDYKHWLFDTYYKEKTYENTIIKLKTGHHRMLPKLLTNVRATLLETENAEMKALRKGWLEIIELFGGVINDVPVFDKEGEVLPYHIQSFDDVEVFYRSNNSCWIVKYEDSMVKKSWVKDWGWCSTVDFSYLSMCLARFKMFAIFDEEFPLLAISDIKPEYMIDDLKENGDPKSVGSSTTTSKVETKSVASVVSNMEGPTVKKKKGKQAPTTQEIQNRLKLPGRGPKATKSKETTAAPKSIAGVVDKPVEIADVDLKRRRGSVEGTSIQTNLTK